MEITNKQIYEKLLEIENLLAKILKAKMKIIIEDEKP